MLLAVTPPLGKTTTTTWFFPITANSLPVVLRSRLWIAKSRWGERKVYSQLCIIWRYPSRATGLCE